MPLGDLSVIAGGGLIAAVTTEKTHASSVTTLSGLLAETRLTVAVPPVLNTAMQRRLAEIMRTPDDRTLAQVCEDVNSR